MLLSVMPPTSTARRESSWKLKSIWTKSRISTSLVLLKTTVWTKVRSTLILHTQTGSVEKSTTTSWKHTSVCNKTWLALAILLSRNAQS
jgi:hypothetical protein